MIEGCYIMSGINKEETITKVLVKLANLVEEQSAKIDLQTKQIAKQQKQIEELNHYVHNNLCEEEIKRISCEAINEAGVPREGMLSFIRNNNKSFDGVVSYFEEVKSLIRETANNTAPVYIPTQSSRGLF